MTWYTHTHTHSFSWTCKSHKHTNPPSAANGHVHWNMSECDVRPSQLTNVYKRHGPCGYLGNQTGSVGSQSFQVLLLRSLCFPLVALREQTQQQLITTWRWEFKRPTRTVCSEILSWSCDLAVRDGKKKTTTLFALIVVTKSPSVSCLSISCLKHQKIKRWWG